MSAIWSLGAAGGDRRPCWGKCLKLWLQSSMQVQLSLVGFLLASLAFLLLGAVIKGKSYSRCTVAWQHVSLAAELCPLRRCKRQTRSWLRSNVLGLPAGGRGGCAGGRGLRGRGGHARHDLQHEEAHQLHGRSQWGAAQRACRAHGVHHAGVRGRLCTGAPLPLPGWHLQVKISPGCVRGQGSASMLPSGRGGHASQEHALLTL